MFHNEQDEVRVFLELADKFIDYSRLRNYLEDSGWHNPWAYTNYEILKLSIARSLPDWVESGG